MAEYLSYPFIFGYGFRMVLFSSLSRGIQYNWTRPRSLIELVTHRSWDTEDDNLGGGGGGGRGWPQGLAMGREYAPPKHSAEAIKEMLL